MRHDDVLHLLHTLSRVYPDRVTILTPDGVTQHRTIRGWTLIHTLPRDASVLEARCRRLLEKRHSVAVGLVEDGQVAVFSRPPAVTIDATTTHSALPTWWVPQRVTPRLWGMLAALLATLTVTGIVAMGGDTPTDLETDDLNASLDAVMGGSQHRLRFVRAPVVDQTDRAGALNAALIAQAPAIAACPMPPDGARFSVQLHVRSGAVAPRLISGALRDRTWRCVSEALQQIPTTGTLPDVSVSFFEITGWED